MKKFLFLILLLCGCDGQFKSNTEFTAEQLVQNGCVLSGETVQKARKELGNPTQYDSYFVYNCKIGDMSAKRMSLSKLEKSHE